MRDKPASKKAVDSLALSAALDVLKKRDGNPQRNPFYPGGWVYFAAEVDSWYYVPEASMVALGMMDRIDVDVWAENDDTSEEIGPELP